jgi:hypothetical protein
MADLAIFASPQEPAERAIEDITGLDLCGLLQRQMQRRGLWIDGDPYREILMARKTLGERLSREIQIPLAELPDAGARSIRTQLRLRSSWSRRLAFGYELSFGFHGFLAGKEPSQSDSAVMGAIFNLGIALFDHVCDNLSEGPRDLACFFDENMLLRLSTTPGAHIDLATDAQRIPDAEIRLLLLTVSAFFMRLENLSRVTRDAEKWQTLNRLLLHAYRAQISCSRTPLGGSSLKYAQRAIMEKSILPFAVILQLIRVCSKEKIEPARERSADRLARQVATVFWLIDDLVDFRDDFRNGHANALLSVMPPCATAQRAGLPVSKRIAMPVIDRICMNLSAAVRTCSSAKVRSTSGHGFDAAILAYARKWVDRAPI